MALTDNDKDYLNNLMRAQNGEIKSDMRWMKGLAGFAIACLGASITFLYPTAKEIHDDVQVIKSKISKYESDHIKCHRWEWRTTSKGEHP